MGFLDKITPEKIDVRIIWWMVFISTFITLAVPIDLPLTLSERTVKAYQFIEKLPAGGIVLFANDATSGAYPELEPGAVAVIRHLVRRNLKFVLCGAGAPENGAMSEILIAKCISEKALPAEKKYGVDYVNVGYIPGAETAVAALGTDFAKLVTKDYRGTPVSQIPILKDVVDYKSFVLVVNTDGGSIWSYWMRHWTVAHGTPFITIPTYAILTTVLPYYSGGTILGVVAAMRGGAEYEKMVNYFSFATKSTSMLSIVSFLCLGLFALGNILELRKKLASPEGRR